jgi:hypothetical protein
MRVLNNTRLIARRARIGQVANLGGILVLGAGLVISLTRPEWSIYTLAMLIVGVILSQFGIANAYRYSRKPRPDEELANALKGLDDRYRLYNYVLPVSHVLLTPKKLYVVILRGMSGKFICEGRKWRQERRFSLGALLRLFSPEPFGNPVREAEWDKEALEQWLSKNLNGLTVEVEPIVVFLHPRAELELRNPAVVAVKAKGLKEQLRKAEGRSLSFDEYRQLAQAFDALAVR